MSWDGLDFLIGAVAGRPSGRQEKTHSVCFISKHCPGALILPTLQQSRKRQLCGNAARHFSFSHVPVTFGMGCAHLASNGTPKTRGRCDWADRPTGRLGCTHQSFFPCRSQGARRTGLHCGVFFNSRCCGSGWLRHLSAGNPGRQDEGNDWKSFRASHRYLGSNLQRWRIRGHPGFSLPNAAAPIPLAALNYRDLL